MIRNGLRISAVGNAVRDQSRDAQCGAGLVAALAAFAGRQRRCQMFILSDRVEGEPTRRIGFGDFNRLAAAHPGDGDVVSEVDNARIFSRDEVRLRTRAGKHRDLRFDGHGQALKQCW